MMIDRSGFLTEQRLAESMGLDAMSARQIVQLMHEQDIVAAQAVGRVGDELARVVDMVAEAFGRGGRLFYVGAGTSGRLGVLDASECPPTFRADPSMVQGIMAGGNTAVFSAAEDVEDSHEGGAGAIDEKNVTDGDVVVGIAAGGTTPFVHGALQQAKRRGAKTVFITCVAAFTNEPVVDVVIRLLTGPEVLTGSTRLKAGTATKLALNMITTGAMVRIGKCYENLMVDLAATNQKLWDRGARIIMQLTDLPRPQAMQLLRDAGGHVKCAIVMHHLGLDLTGAKQRLEQARGQLRRALQDQAP